MTDPEVATCRGCGMILRGRAYWFGGQACHPKTGEQCRINYYGGFVCSKTCDWNASMRMATSMPGARGKATTLDTFALEGYRRNWPE